MTALAFEQIIDSSGASPRIEALLPAGVRRRQLSIRTLLAGICLTQAAHRPAHLTRVHRTLTSLPEDEQRRLGVITDWKHGPHQLTYRQTERTFGLAAAALGKDQPDGLPSRALQAACDRLLEASIPDQLTGASTSLAADWTDNGILLPAPAARHQQLRRPRILGGHRKNNLLRSQDELFYGYYLSAGVMMPGENRAAVPELARRATVSSPRHDPVRAFAPVLTALPGQQIPLGDILDDSGYAQMAVNALRTHRDRQTTGPPPASRGAIMTWSFPPEQALPWTRLTSGGSSGRPARPAGIGPKWTPRELRHSFVSLLSSTGVPVEEIARLTGHANSRTTEVVYRRELTGSGC